MEIVFELILSFFGYLLQFFAEILLQGIFEAAAELGLRSLVEPFRRPKPISPFLATVGYVIYGGIAGAISLQIPQMFVIAHPLRVANLIITPIACGSFMAWLGKYREKKGTPTIRLDTFMYGYLFALSMAAVRFIWR